MVSRIYFGFLTLSWCGVVYPVFQFDSRDMYLRPGRDGKPQILQGLAGVLIDGHYGQICDDGNFNDAAAKIFCTHMNFTTGRVGDGQKATAPLVLKDVSCTGAEQHLANCVHIVTNTSGCYNAVTITCMTKDPVLYIMDGEWWILPVACASVIFGFGAIFEISKLIKRKKKKKDGVENYAYDGPYADKADYAQSTNSFNSIDDSLNHNSSDVRNSKSAYV